MCSGLIGKSITAAGLNDLKPLKRPMGQFSADINEKPYSVSFLRSSLNNWTYLSLTSIDSLTKESSKIGTYTIYICVLMLILFIAARMASFA